jgi:alpha-tubulin suppressor-like RCC1 family protein
MKRTFYHNSSLEDISGCSKCSKKAHLKEIDLSFSSSNKRYFCTFACRLEYYNNVNETLFRQHALKVVSRRFINNNVFYAMFLMRQLNDVSELCRIILYFMTKEKFIDPTIKRMSDIEFRVIQCYETYTTFNLPEGHIIAGDDKQMKFLMNGCLDDSIISPVPFKLFEESNFDEIFRRKTFSFFRNYKKGLYACGANDLGQLGLPSSVYIEEDLRLTKVSTPDNAFVIDNFDSIYVGNNHTIWLVKGRIFGVGDNLKGQLGVGSSLTTVSNGKPVEIFYDNCSVDIVEKVYVDGDSTFIITQSNIVYSCGDNSSGQLGVGDCENRFFMTKIRFPIDDVDRNLENPTLYCANKRTWFFSNKGEDCDYACGDNKFGCLGVGRSLYTAVCTPTKICVTRRTLVQNDGFRWKEWKTLHIVNSSNHLTLLYGIPKKYPRGVLFVCGNIDAYKLTARFDNYSALHTFTSLDMTIYTQTMYAVHFDKINIGSSHITLFDKKNQHVFGCGNNEKGQLGLGSLCLSIDELTKLYIMYKGDGDKSIAVMHTSNVTGVFSSFDSTFITTKEKKIYATGGNEYGQLGLGHKEVVDRWTEVQVSSFTLAKIPPVVEIQ